MSASRAKTAYVCHQCGGAAARWLGRCPSCGAWNSLVEERIERTSAPANASQQARPVALKDARVENARRLPTGIGELDRVLGGGVLAGGVVLVGGDPGIGKSTLLMQGLGGLLSEGHRVLYVTGEESASQVALRGERIGGDAFAAMQILATSELADVEGALSAESYEAVVVDSIQTLRSGSLESAAGSVAQLREVSSRLIEIAKRTHVALFLIGHVTKDGALAGPKVLEHLVDTVLSFEGDRTHAFRLLRATKNRFGAAQEVGVFEMVREGLREVPDPSAFFLKERPEGAAGSLVVPSAEGTRPLLIEVQALVAPAVYGASRRVASGMDANRLAILLAVLERKAGVHVLDRDVFASVTGGVHVEERALDLGLAIAVVSSLRERAVAPSVVAFGEVGLAGEVRGVPRPGIRLAEARKLGFRRAILPLANAERVTAEERQGIELVGVASLDAGLTAAFES